MQTFSFFSKNETQGTQGFFQERPPHHGEEVLPAVRANKPEYIQNNAGWISRVLVLPIVRQWHGRLRGCDRERLRCEWF